MARVTRSKKIDIAEDQTAFAIQTPSPQTPFNQPLAELSKENNAMPSMEEENDNLEVELKGLKAAYRAALGVGKKAKKLKGKKRNKQEPSDQFDDSTPPVLEGHISTSIAPSKSKKDNKALGQENISNSQPFVHDQACASDENRPISQGSHYSLGSLPRHLSKLTLQDLTEATEAFEQSNKPVPRTTRQQGARLQTGLQDLTNTREVAEEKEESFARVTRHRAARVLAGQFDFFLQGPQQSNRLRLPDNYILSLSGGCTTRLSQFLGYGLTSVRIKTDTFLSADKDARKDSTLATEYIFESLIQDSTSIPKRIPAANVEVGDESTNSKTASQSPTHPAVKTLEEVESAFAEAPSATPTADTEDSFVEQIICRSPAKPVSRIEDSVEALDQLEEALEAIDQAALTERILSPTDRVQSKLTAEQTISVASPELKLRKQPRNPKASTVRIKPTVPRAPVIKRPASASFKSASPIGEEPRKAQPPKKAPMKRPASLLPPKEPVKSRKPPTLPTKFELPGEAVARRLKEQREARQAQREASENIVRPIPGLKIKSTKPPTKPTFELPGEAISRRKRDAQEARIKAQEEEERARREFKAKPLRKSVVPSVVPRETAASRARQSKVGLESIDSDTLSVSKRSSNVGTHRAPSVHVTSANMSAPRSSGNGLERNFATQTTAAVSLGHATRRSVSSSDVQAQRQRGKEIYNRDFKLAEDIEREKREREAAAKRSREEAAERGRQASREWAEKMKAKKVAGGDKGMGVGYGPGGQLGLRR